MTEEITEFADLDAKQQEKPRNGRKLRARKTPAGRGVTRLRDSANSLVSRESDRIIEAVIEEIVDGNMTAPRRIFELTGADQAPVPKKKKRRGLSDAERMASECDPEEYRLSRLQPGQPEWDEEDERILQLAISCNGNIHSLPEPPNPAPAPAASETK